MVLYGSVKELTVFLKKGEIINNLMGMKCADVIPKFGTNEAIQRHYVMLLPLYPPAIPFEMRC